MSTERFAKRGRAWFLLVPGAIATVCATAGVAAEKTDVITQEVVTKRLLDALDERQMPDVSLLVLERVAKDAESYPSLQKEAPYRRATALVATSRLETDGAKRAQILDAAGKEIERFLDGSPTGEQAIAAFTQKGNLLVERGRAKVDQSKRPGEDAKARLAEAVTFFDAAIKALEGQATKDQEITAVSNAEDAVLKELRAVDAQLAELQGKAKADGEESGKGGRKGPRKPSDGRLIEQLEERQDRLRGQLLQTRLLVGGAYYEKSRALPTGSKEWKAALEKSAADYKELYDKYRSRGAGLFARYYEGRNYVAIAQAEKDEKEKKKRMEQALLTLSDVRGLDGEAGFVPGLRAKAVASTLECWLDMKAYAAKEFKDFDERLQKIVLAAVPAERLDADWLAMKYRSALLFERMADAQPDKTKGRPLLTNAKKLALEVAKVNRDYSKEARALLEQLGKSLPEDAAGMAASFESAMDAVRVSLSTLMQKQGEAKQLQAAGKAAEADAAMKAVAADREKVIAGIRKALPLATTDDVDAVNQARYMLTFMLYDGRRLHDAAALGTFLAERYPNAKGSRQAAKVAMASLQQLSKDGVPEWRAAAKRQCADVAGLILRTWPDDAESADAAVIAIATATEARDPERLIEILDQVPAASPRRAEVLLRAGSALWRDVLEKRVLEEGVRPAADVLASWKRRAAGAIDEGLTAIPAGAPPTKTTVAAALARVQMAIDDGDRDLAMRVLTQPDYGPWTLVTGKDPAYTTGPLAESTLTVALRFFIQAEQLDKAQEAMDRLEAVAGTGDEASAKLTAMYLTMGRDLQAQLDALGAGGASAIDAAARAAAILGGFEKFLDVVAKRDPKVSSQMWVATTYLSLGSGAGTGSVVPTAKADGYLAKAADAYKRLLDKGGDEIVTFEPAIRLKVANVYRELGRWDEAQEQIDWILSDPKRQNSLEAQIQAAELLQAAGEKSADKAKAEQYLKEAIIGRRNGASVAWGWGGIGNKLARQAFAGSDEKALDARSKFFTARLNVAKCRLKRAEMATQDREKLLTMAFNDVAITFKLYPEMGGKGMEKQFDKLLKEIEKAQGSPAPKGLNGLREAQQAAAEPAAAGTRRKEHRSMSGLTTGWASGGLRAWRVLAWAMVMSATAAVCGTAAAQSPDRLITTEGSFTGKVVATSAEAVDLEDRNGETQKIPVDQLREVQFGGEPQSLRAARSLLARGRAADAVEEVAKIEAAELDGAEPLLLDEVDFVKAAAAGRAALAAGADPKDAGRLVGEFLAKHPKSHHFYEMQQLLGDLLFRAGKPDAALTAYSTLAKGPAAFKVRAASAKAGMLFDQQKFAEAMAEYEAAIKIEANDDASAEQKRSAQLGKARCLTQTGKNSDAVALVQGIIKQADPEEKELLGRAYNVLGAAYRGAGDKDQDALISYLTVDLVYNGSPDSHAEALANLAELWDKVKQTERAREARKLLQESYPTSPWAKKQAATAGT